MRVQTLLGDQRARTDRHKAFSARSLFNASFPTDMASLSGVEADPNEAECDR